MFEGVSQAVPDSNLLNLVALRAGEAWYRASSCPEAISWLTKAVSGNDKDPQIAQAWLRMASSSSSPRRFQLRLICARRSTRATRSASNARCSIELRSYR